ncbi:MAG: sigma-54-dependent Fis family transcriptional regulator [Alphaproteobacteria bacterium]|nr:sigma-54-dependent Fis family transcriptional regulator [Alphaproteobacteria bacterium]
MAYEILIVDDESDIREVISDLLQDEGYQTRSAPDGETAIEMVKQRRPHLIILDIWLGSNKLDGIKVLDILQKEFPGLPVVMMSGHGNIETAVNSIKLGAYDYVEKPFKADRLLLVLTRAFELFELRRENKSLKQKVISDVSLVGGSPYIHSLRATIDKISAANSRVLLQGPTGSGKETIARQIHNLSPRAATGAFFVLNCSQLSAEQFDESLFGREDQGRVVKVGLIEQANGGTLLLDEVADIPFASQNKLTRALQESVFTRVGGKNSIVFDVRIFSSTSKDILKIVEEGAFSEDLYYRLNVVLVKIASLKDRREDIPALADELIKEYSHLNGCRVKKISEEALNILKSYDWPGNIRQLRNMIEWVMIMSGDSQQEQISVDSLPPEILTHLPSGPDMDTPAELMELPLREARDYFERKYLLSQVSRFSGNVSQTASFIGMERSALHRKLRSLGLKRTGS